MAGRYAVNNNPDHRGHHEVHREGCRFWTLLTSVTPLGYHETCHTAVVAAKQIYWTADGCFYCSRTCHSG